MLSLNSKIEEVPKVGPKYLKKLHKLKIKTIRDLFFHFPHRYEDLSQVTPLHQLKVGQKALVQGKIKKVNLIQTPRRRMKLVEIVIEEKNCFLRAVWFNQPYLVQTFKEGRTINLSGKVIYDQGLLTLTNPSYEIISKKDLIHTGRLVPIYPETAGLTSRYLRYLIKSLFHLTNQFSDFLPPQIKKKYQLINLSQAIREIHFPKNNAYLKAARRRLSFNELLLIQLGVLKQKQKIKQKKAPLIPFNSELVRSFVQTLPFKLTDDQRLAAWEIFKDLSTSKPMNRLLNGDVGSGKTIVAILAAFTTAKAGYQVALMAPTEVLAKQHFQTFKKSLQKQGLKIALFTSADQLISPREKTNRSQLKKLVHQGKINIIIGTHALIANSQEKQTSSFLTKNTPFFKKLGLVIIDEQHRFGVLQRATLQNQAFKIKDDLPTIPHLLSMTATPIPRTLALTLYGDLDISVIKQMPKGRKKIITKLITPEKRKEAYGLIKKQLQQKKQAFIICPLIDESNKIEAQSVIQEYEKLSKDIFPQFKVAMLHGKLKPKEKEEIMKKFLRGKIDILISTSVVEVGVDVPKATVIAIEGAERFGLAQLHQFRGRVGRSSYQSYCLLFTNSSNPETNQRLKAILSSEDGFKLAEKDLQIRGPGDFIGTRQWGIPPLVMASLEDIELIKKARQAAQEIINNNLFTLTLKNQLKEFEKLIHLE